MSRIVCSQRGLKEGGGERENKRERERETARAREKEREGERERERKRERARYSEAIKRERVHVQSVIHVVVGALAAPGSHTSHSQQPKLLHDSILPVLLNIENCYTNGPNKQHLQ